MVFGAWTDKSCKTTLALTFPKPLAYLEFDVGGFDRAKYRFKEDVASGNIITSYKDGKGKEHLLRYVMPYQYDAIDATKLTVRPSKRITGIKELWYRFLVNYMQLLEDDGIATVVVDTATLLWEICATAYLQEKQELQLDVKGNVLPNEKLRVNLLPIEYREPNIRMRGIIYQAKAHGKHLVLTHHAKDEYAMMPVKGEMVEARTGRKERSGWGQLGDGADVIVHTYIKMEKQDKNKRVPYCKVELAEVQELVDMEFKEPTYEQLASVIAMIKGEWK